jgi:hypothetical protein
MSLRTTLLALATVLAAHLFTAAEATAQAGCTTPSSSLTATIDTILYNVDLPDLPMVVTANLSNGGGSASTTFNQNGTGTITLTGDWLLGDWRLVSATVNGTTVCHGSSGSVQLPSGDVATIEVGTSQQSGRPYIRVSVSELQ